MTAVVTVFGLAAITVVGLWLADQARLMRRERGEGTAALAALPPAPTLAERRWELDDTQPIPLELVPVAPPTEGRPVALYLPPLAPRPRSHRPARVVRRACDPPLGGGRG